MPIGLRVVVGIADRQASGLGVNITCSGDTYLSLGTSVISGTFSDHYIFSGTIIVMPKKWT